MEIRWYGHSCFRLKHRKGIIVADPYHKDIGFSLPPLRADMVTISHDHPHHNHAAGVKGIPKVLAGPGEYEIKGIFIKGIAAGGWGKDRPAQERNTAYVFDFGDFTVCHLGNLNHIPDQGEIDEIGEPDILLAPVGGGMGLNASQAAEVVSLLQPRIVIPMHYGVTRMDVALAPVGRFLKEMGLDEAATLESLSVQELPEGTQVVVLKCEA